MWLFTEHGLLSVVQHERDPNTLILRARAYEHLERACKAYRVPEEIIKNIIGTPTYDYPYRVEISRATFIHMMSSAGESVQYTNFKAHVSKLDLKYYSALLTRVWDMGRRMFEEKTDGRRKVQDFTQW